MLIWTQGKVRLLPYDLRGFRQTEMILVSIVGGFFFYLFIFMSFSNIKYTTLHVFKITECKEP